MGDDFKMDWKKIIITLIIIIILAYGGYKTYHYVLGLSDDSPTVSQKMIGLLQQQQGLIIKLQTEIADIEKRVVNDTLKETIIIQDDGKTYEGLKDTLLELRENEDVNKEEIEQLRTEYEKRINEYRESIDKIMITAGEEKVVIYEDIDGNLVSLNEGVEIIRHRKTEPLLEKDLQIGQVIESEPYNNFSFSILYDGDFSPALSYSILDWKDLSLNATAYDFENPRLGADISYNIRGNLEIGAGVGLLDIMQMEMIRDFYVRFGIRIEF